MLKLLPHIESLQNLRAIFQRHNRDLRVVGGCIRDILLGRIPSDVDLCTDATPDEQRAIYEAENIRHIDTGLKHGTYSVVLYDPEQIVLEITSLRIDTNQDGRHADVIYTRDWLLDLSRRDFTINAMSLTFDDELIDPFNGFDHLMAGKVVFVGNAAERIREDYLRILRWFRFSARYTKNTDAIDHQILDIATWDVVKEEGHGLKKISRERIWFEISKILSGPHGPEMIGNMRAMCLDQYMDLPNGDMINLCTAKDHTNDPVALMAAYCNDVAKIKKLAMDWKWSIEERNKGVLICENFLRKSDFDLKDAKRQAVLGFNKDWLAIALSITGQLKESAILMAWDIPIFPVTGADIVALGNAPGPTIGNILKSMRDRWIESDYTMSRNDLIGMLTY